MFSTKSFHKCLPLLAMILSAFCKRPATLVGALVLYVVGYVALIIIIPLGACVAKTRLPYVQPSRVNAAVSMAFSCRLLT